VSLSTPARVEALEVFVALLSEADAPEAPESFFNRICEAVCRLTTMERAVVFFYDDARREVRAVGAHAIELAELADLRTSLGENPWAQKALGEDRVVVIAERFDEELPAVYERFLPITKLTGTPISAAGRWFGVILADRAGADFDLSQVESHALWTLGKLAALAASARLVAHQQERARGLADRIELARDIHDRVVQRLFGVSLALSTGQQLEADERARLGAEVHSALSDLREALARPLAPRQRSTGIPLRAELERLAQDGGGLPVKVSCIELEDMPERLEPLVQAALAEALRNAAKHADPSRVEVTARRDDGAFVLEVENDGVNGEPSAAGGMGLRLTAVEALQEGGMLEFGPPAPGLWRMRLVLPAEEG
jgi:signal transduction histidine kinase